MYKDFYKSKTFWAGTSAIIASLGLLMTGEATLPEFLLGANGILSIILRYFTNQPINTKK